MKTNVLCYLEDSAKRVPDKCAVRDERTALTYAELHEYSRRIGTALLPNVDVGEPVGVYLEQSARSLCAFFGVVHAGGFYSVLNVQLPAGRLGQMADVLEPKVILTSEDLMERAAELFPGRHLLTLEQLLETEPDDEALALVRARCIDTQPLYLNFTSGSTGIPKGIVVGHRSTLDFIEVFTERFGITEDDVLANQAPFDFDVSVKDIYSCLKTGATLVVVPRRFFTAPTDLMDFLCDQQITTMVWAVSALCLLTTFHAFEYRTPGTLRKILFSGEVLPAKALKALRTHLPDAMLVNLYGPTEITCNCTYHILEPERDYTAGIPIGKAFPNEDVFLLDKNDQKITGPDQVGELCVRGTALALGYYRNPEQTAKAFVQNPLNHDYPERIYRTGDLARFDRTGDLFFCGRKDFQIKYLGHRVELEEIEREMGAIAGVERCCCVFEEARQRLKGFYVGQVPPEALHAQMREKLPVYMVPGSLRRVPAMPLTKNGKIDRRTLETIGEEAIL